MRARGVALAVLAALAAARVCFAQDPDDASSRASDVASMLRLLQNEDVRQEVGLDQGQAAAIDVLESRRRAGMRDNVSRLMQVPVGERREELHDLEEERSQQYESIQTELEAVLRPEQRERLRQIELQQQVQGIGLAATLASEPVAGALGLGDEEKKKLRETARAADEELGREIERVRAELYQRVLAALTPAQREVWARMVGESFTRRLPPPSIPRAP